LAQPVHAANDDTAQCTAHACSLQERTLVQALLPEAPCNLQAGQK
jgi:hypothetical protein